MPTSAYMLQLLGTVEERRARNFVKQYVGRLPITYFETRLRNKPWFVVLAGPYDDREAAVAGVGALPQKLQLQKPWVRSVVGVQTDIRKLR